MEAAPARLTGGCLCGAVRYVATGEPVNQRVCHCRQCQKAVGAAFNGRMLFRQDDVAITGPVSTFASSAALTRGFCARCGTSLFAARAQAGVVGLSAGSLDDPARFRPTMHIWAAMRQPWLRLADGLPQHPGAAP